MGSSIYTRQNDGDEYTTLRHRQNDFIEAQDQDTSKNRSGNEKAAFQVVAGSGLPGVYQCSRVIPGGAETVNAGLTVVTRPGSTFVIVVGTRSPSPGDLLNAHLISGRWVAEVQGISTSGFRFLACNGTWEGNGVKAGDIQVKIYDATHTTLLLTLLTDVTGRVTFSLTPGTYKYDYAEVHSGAARFVPATNQTLVLPLVSSLSVTPAVNSLYVCTVLCVYPLAKTLIAKGASIGNGTTDSVTLTYVSGYLWQGTQTFTYPALPSGTVSALIRVSFGKPLVAGPFFGPGSIHVEQDRGTGFATTSYFSGPPSPTYWYGNGFCPESGSWVFGASYSDPISGDYDSVTE